MSEPCKHCGKVWRFGTCASTVSRQARCEMVTADEPEFYCPSVDVCGWCGDVECDGIGCIASLNPDNPGDLETIERLHATLRAGQIFIQANAALAAAENRA